MAIEMHTAAPPQVRRSPKIIKIIAPTDIVTSLHVFCGLFEDTGIFPFGFAEDNANDQDTNRNGPSVGQRRPDRIAAIVCGKVAVKVLDCGDTKNYRSYELHGKFPPLANVKVGDRFEVLTQGNQLEHPTDDNDLYQSGHSNSELVHEVVGDVQDI